MKTVTCRVPCQSSAAVMRMITDEDPVSSVSRQRSLRLPLNDIDQRRSLREIRAVKHGLRVTSRHKNEHVGALDTQRAGDAKINDGVGILQQLRLPREHREF